MVITNHAAAEFEPNVKRGEPVTVRPAAGPTADEKDGYYFLSNIDRILVFVRTVYWYGATPEGGRKEEKDVAEVIKDALSKVLVHYYPLTGRLTITPQGKLAVTFAEDCGALFVEAEADCRLEEIVDLIDPRSPVGEKLVYSTCPGAVGFEVLGQPLLMVQVTKFKCGGFSLGIAICHCLVDGVSAMEFVNSWGELARGLPLSVPPFLDRTILKSRQPPQIQFPHHEYATMEDKSSSTALANEKFVIESFCFDPDTITRIKAEASSPGQPPSTTFLALAAFVWKARTKALKVAPDQPTKFLVTVDIRNKMEPQLPKGYFGNGMVLAGTTCLAGEVTERPLPYLVGLIKEGIAVTDEYVRSGIDYVETTGALLASDHTMMPSKWIGLDFDNADFGWGPPMGSAPVGSLIDYVVLFLAAGADRKSVQIFVTLKASAMEMFRDLMASVTKG